MKLEDLRNKKIALVGLGVNNAGLAKYFKRDGLPFSVIEHWGEPDELTQQLKQFEIIFRTPGLPFLSEAVQSVKRSGVQISSQTKLFFDLCPAKIIGVTGTKGKGTTATLISRMLEAAKRKVWLAGNIGADPFEFLEEIGPSDLVVLELSSFQLQDIHKSPHIAVVLKITPEHLDYHKDFAEYLAAKQGILRFQTASDFAILNHDQGRVRELSKLTEAEVYWNSVLGEVEQGCFVAGEEIFLKLGERRKKIMNCKEVGLLGRFNLENVTAAAAAAAAAGISDTDLIKRVIKDFKGLEHRLEFVREVDGVKYYNDTFATTPETTVAAITAFDAPIILLVGGSEKNADYSELGKKIATSKVKVLISIGLTGKRIIDKAREGGFAGEVVVDKDFTSMDEVVRAAEKRARPGDVVLLSPAAASFDKFENYKERGKLFKRAIDSL